LSNKNECIKLQHCFFFDTNFNFLLATLQHWNFATYTFCNLKILQHWNFATLKFATYKFGTIKSCNIKILQLKILATLKFSNIEILQTWNFATLKFFDLEILQHWNFATLFSHTNGVPKFAEHVIYRSLKKKFLLNLIFFKFLSCSFK